MHLLPGWRCHRNLPIDTKRSAEHWYYETQIAQSLAHMPNDALRIVNGLFITLLMVCVFVIITATATSQEDLLRGEVSFALPLFQVDIGLKPFAGLAPWVVWILHVYLLFHLRLTLPKVHEFSRTLHDLFDGDDKKLRQYLHNTPLVQLLFGYWREHDRHTYRFLHVISFIMLVLLPMVTIFYMEYRSLAFHDILISGSQITAQIMDCGSVIFLWRRIVRLDSKTPSLHTNIILIPIAVAVFLSVLMVMAFAWSFWLPNVSWLPERPTLQLEGAVIAEGDDSVVHELVNRMRTSDSPEAWQESGLKVGGLRLQGRDLSGANLKRAKLPNAKLLDIDLQGADLTGAQLPWVELEDVKMQGATLDHAILYEAKLERVDLDLGKKSAVKIDLTGARLSHITSLSGDWTNAQLNDAKLLSVDIESGSDFNGVSLENARLDVVTLNGVSLQDAIMNGAVLDSVELKGANLISAQIVGVKVESEVYLNDADLSGADLRGAILRDAEFNERTDLRGADLTGADLRGTTLYLEKLNKARLGLADLRGVEPCPPEDATCLEKWQAMVLPEEPCLMTTAWGPCWGEERLAEYDERLAEFLAVVACGDNKASTHAVIRRIELFKEEKDDDGDPPRPSPEVLARRLAAQDCPALTCLSAKDWAPVAKYLGPDAKRKECPLTR
uniref:Uncharacterized protein YjbI, contains pentapeptide repeats n=1 Tax=Candidatus Kentrum sp. FM TaxID=2126340 RepID=A0A450W0R6_9GAMM|nr:MAG: Uncharacterized protein YjbI, contains pentapeptide repeats [Candidatus Kentron sp. FM]VFJ55580.1 MAG: Uncharacterized protein YjbI, contains pentapeptide repeats [Candidatus Kentron sp. FM]VFK10644.1 MAG: Uncharacterized protein YjbI, contains pentapeptide repeats [Candidatus Kentron sp. FM]